MVLMAMVISRTLLMIGMSFVLFLVVLLIMIIMKKYRDVFNFSITVMTPFVRTEISTSVVDT